MKIAFASILGLFVLLLFANKHHVITNSLTGWLAFLGFVAFIVYIVILLVRKKQVK